MDSGTADLSSSAHVKASNVQPTAAVEYGSDNAASDASSRVSVTGISSWVKLKIPQSLSASDDSQTENAGKSTFARFTSGLGMRLSPKSPPSADDAEGNATITQTGLFGTFAKGLVDTSKSAVKAVQVKARHAVSQNKRRYQEGEFDLDMTYITENIIAMGFPAGDMSSGFFGYVEGFYRNHMEEVIKFFETHHKGKYKVYNLCSERLYDASLFEGKVASFPFNDHNCPPIQLITLFCQSAYSWLKQDIENVVVVHCKAGMARTGLMISSLLLYLKFFPTAEESMDYYNQKRCFDGKGLVLPSQIRYVKYFERILTYFNGEIPPARRCMLRGFRLHRCPYWIRPSITVSDHNGVIFSTKKHPRTKDLSPEDFWFAPRKGVIVFALPGEPGLTKLAGDFKIQFHDHQGDFYCWLNTTMMDNKVILTINGLDGFDKRKLPSPGFQVEVVVVDYADPVPTTPSTGTATKRPDESSGIDTAAADGGGGASPNHNKESGNQEGDDVFSDNEADDAAASKTTQAKTSEISTTATSGSETNTHGAQVSSLTKATENASIGNKGATQMNTLSESRSNAVRGVSGIEVGNSDSEFKVIAADASVFSFGDDEDYESE